MHVEELQKKIGKEIKKLRCLHEWTQEQVAEQLNIGRNAYGEIERGETDINLSRLAQISELFKIDLGTLLGISETGVQYLQHYANLQKNYNTCHIHHSETLQQVELEKMHLLVAQKDKEIELLQREIAHLQKIIALMEVRS